MKLKKLFIVFVSVFMVVSIVSCTTVDKEASSDIATIGFEMEINVDNSASAARDAAFNEARKHAKNNAGAAQMRDQLKIEKGKDIEKNAEIETYLDESLYGILKDNLPEGYKLTSYNSARFASDVVVNLDYGFRDNGVNVVYDIYISMEDNDHLLRDPSMNASLIPYETELEGVQEIRTIDSYPQLTWKANGSKFASSLDDAIDLVMLDIKRNLTENFMKSLLK